MHHLILANQPLINPLLSQISHQLPKYKINPNHLSPRQHPAHRSNPTTPTPPLRRFYYTLLCRTHFSRSPQLHHPPPSQVSQAAPQSNQIINSFPRAITLTRKVGAVREKKRFHALREIEEKLGKRYDSSMEVEDLI